MVLHVGDAVIHVRHSRRATRNGALAPGGWEI